jgi:hypothetical protein
MVVAQLQHSTSFASRAVLYRNRLQENEWIEDDFLLSGATKSVCALVSFRGSVLDLATHVVERNSMLGLVTSHLSSVSGVQGWLRGFNQAGQ